MLNIERILHDDRLMRAMTGLNLRAFNALKPAFSQALSEAEVPRRSDAPRQRAPGAGRTPRLATVEHQLFYILVYFKCYPTFDLAGVLFDLDRSQAHRWMHRLQPVLAQALGREMALPKRKISSMEDFVQAFPGVKRMILDGTERPIQRPSNRERQKQNYSGKKKRHTRSHLAGSDGDGRILLLSVSYDGKDHDKGILNREQWADYIPDEVLLQGDSGFDGLQRDFVNVETTHKKPRGGELTQQQKEENRALAKERIVVEHAFSGVKRYRIASDVYRNRIEDFDDRSMLTSAGLWNFYLMAA